MAGKQLWGWDPTNKVWVPLAVDANGCLKVDMTNINLNDLADVSVAAPADDDLFYFDNATSLWKSRKLVDADIPAAIARDAEITADIATHAALTTGVHGVGAYYIAKIAESGGEAPLKRRSLLLQSCFLHFEWESLDKWFEQYIGTGARVSWDLARLIEGTGTTINSEARLYTNWIANYCWQATQSLFFKLQNWGTAITNFEWLLGLWEYTVARPPPLTAKHVGWKVIDGDVYATVADGTTETAVDTGENLTSIWDALNLYFEKDPAASQVKFYIDKTLRATISTNLPPSNSNTYLYISVKTTDTADKRLCIANINGRIY